MENASHLCDIDFVPFSRGHPRPSPRTAPRLPRSTPFSFRDIATWAYYFQFLKIFSLTNDAFVMEIINIMYDLD